MSILQSPFVAAALTAACLSCGGGSRSDGGAAAAVAEPAARAELVDSSGTSVGTATFAPGDGGVQIAVRASGLTPGRHGIHLHETGSCEPPDFKSAGEHFNPTTKQHGLDNPAGPHAGDMPNLSVGSDGAADTTLVAAGATLGQGATSLISAGGRAIVIHAGADDQKSDPSGNSGGRVACGVVAPT